mgnify:FL=1|jgi:hypothetical protein
MDAFDEILNKLPSDIGGSTADNGFTFQKNWALMKLLELEESGKSYTIIFDYHDDIQVLDSDENASAIDFYQIKTSVNYWIPSTLCKKEKDAQGNFKKSFLGKLINHFFEFENTRDVFFVTNNYIPNKTIESKNKQRDVVPFTSLTEKAQGEIKEKIQNELGCEILKEYYEHLFIIQNQLHLSDYSDMLVGKIATFLQRKIGNSEINPKAFYDTMLAEVTKRNDYKAICNTKDDMFTHKAISKKQFAEYINGLRNFTSFDSKCKLIVDDLKEGTNLKQRLVIMNKLNKELRNEYFQYDNIEFSKLSNIVRSTCDAIEMGDNDTLWSYGKKVLPMVKLKYSNPLDYDDDFIRALIFYLVYG